MTTNGAHQQEPKPKPARLTAQQQKFALAYVETGNASEAYRRAYPTSKNWKPGAVHVAASRLLANPHISAKANAKAHTKENAKVDAIATGKVAPLVDQLRQQHATRHETTIDDIVAELDEARTLAIELKQPSAAVSASAAKGRLLFGDKAKIEMSGPGGGPMQIEAAAAVRALLEALPELGGLSALAIAAPASVVGVAVEASGVPSEPEGK